jgi:hypothetical protein
LFSFPQQFIKNCPASQFRPICDCWSLLTRDNEMTSNRLPFRSQEPDYVADRAAAVSNLGSQFAVSAAVVIVLLGALWFDDATRDAEGAALSLIQSAVEEPVAAYKTSLCEDGISRASSREKRL